MRKRIVLILAAGKGTRMKSPYPKVLHSLLGKPMISRLIDSLMTINPTKIFVVVGYEAELVKEVIKEYNIEPIYQEPQLGTAHAVMTAKEKLMKEGEADLLIVAGDVPLIPMDEINLFFNNFSNSQNIAALISINLEEPYGYGRVLKDFEGKLKRVVEEKDATPAQKTAKEVNTGVYFLRIPEIFPYLEKIDTKNEQGEYYLPDLFSLIYNDNKRLDCFKGSLATRYLGINSQFELARAEEWLRVSVIGKLLSEGVIIKMPDTVWIEPEAEIKSGAIIHPFTKICGKSRIETETEIMSFSTIIDSTVERGSIIREYTHLEKTLVGRNCKIGPYCRTREGTTTGDDVRLGNFVETKKANIANGVKANHLSYLGDVTIGANTNIGAGTITCNYDGERKLPTVIEDNVFIGSDTQLVAPVKVASGSYVAAGTTVTKDVPPDSLAIARVPQKNIEGWATKRRNKKREGK
ncbi:MAG: bifunctional UDP-N-acetylglucosamine diphosphorylase/glucosamine-1-phosphate N-acetyltransferase GlmU [Acidobacteriota bacterium]